jgi:hypothetical protein
MKFKATTYFTHHFHFDPLIFNPILPSKKLCNQMLIWAQNDSIMSKQKSSRIKLKILKNLTIQSTII